MILVNQIKKNVFGQKADQPETNTTLKNYKPITELRDFIKEIKKRDYTDEESKRHLKTLNVLQDCFKENEEEKTILKLEKSFLKQIKEALTYFF